MNNFGGVSRGDQWLVIRKQTYEQNCQNGTGIWLPGWQPAVQQQWLRTRNSGELPPTELPFKGQLQQVTEESSQCESSSDRWRWNPLGCKTWTHKNMEIGTISPEPRWPGIWRDLDLLDGLTFFWWKISISPPIYSQGITRKDFVKKNGYQTMTFSENCWCSLSNISSILEKTREMWKDLAISQDDMWDSEKHESYVFKLLGTWGLRNLSNLKGFVFWNSGRIHVG